MSETKSADFNVKPREPNNTDAESAILGACLASPAVYDRLRGSLKAEHFYEMIYADTWSHMEEMAAADRRADLITLAPVLKERKLGDAEAIDHLQLLVEAFGGRNSLDSRALDAYVGEVRRFASQRFLAKTGRDLTLRALTPEPNLTEIAGLAVDGIDGALAQSGISTTLATGGDLVREAIEDYLDDDAPVGISTGLRDLDEKTGGLYRGELTILGGRPGSGKTTIAVQIVVNAGIKGVGTLFVSLEMGKKTVGQRLLSSLAYARQTIPYEAFRTDKRKARAERRITDAMLNEARRCASDIENLPILVETEAALSLPAIGSLVRKTRARFEEQGRHLGLVVVDYLGLVKPPDRYAGQRVHEVAEISAGLRALAKRENVHVLALHQLSRAVETREDKRPELHDLRDSGSLEQDADLVLFAFREAYYLERKRYQDGSEEETARCKRLRQVGNVMEINIAKHRSGPVSGLEFFCDIACNRVSDFNP